MSKFNQILVVGGVHGDETTGIELIQKIDQNPISNISTLLANPLAVKKKKRFLETDLNRSFGKMPISKEEKLAIEIDRIIRNYDLVLDFHNTDSEHTDCMIITCQSTPFHLAIAAYFGFDKIVIMPPSGSLIGQIPAKAVSFEISNNSQSKFSVEYFYNKLINFADSFDENIDTSKLEIFEYATIVNYQTYKRLKNKLGIIADFTSFNPEQKEVLGLKNLEERICPLFFEYSAGKFSNTAFIIVK